MKKFITLILALLLLISLCACNFEPMIPGEDQQSESADGQQTDNTNESQTGGANAPADTEYKLTVIDYWGYLIEPLDEYYKAGEEVEVKLAFLSGPSVGIELNGEYIGAQSATKHDGIYPIITFTMPAKDSVLYTTMNGNVGFKSTFSRAGSGRDPDIYLNEASRDQHAFAISNSPPIAAADPGSVVTAKCGDRTAFGYGYVSR